MKTIVIADDFAGFRRYVRSKLQGNGFQIVAEAANGLEAVAKVAMVQPDLVLLDIQMPNLNGLEAAAQIRSIAAKSKILLVSQNTDPDIVRAAMSAGAAGYLCKSKINGALVPAIEAALAG
jgi:DNA-binding NarL/FixJ family response regulator